MKCDPNESAFPIVQEVQKEYTDGTSMDVTDYGLTKREWFAGMAMQGFCSNHQVAETAVELAKWAAGFADALIAELNKESK